MATKIKPGFTAGLVLLKTKKKTIMRFRILPKHVAKRSQNLTHDLSIAERQFFLLSPLKKKKKIKVKWEVDYSLEAPSPSQGSIDTHHNINQGHLKLKINLTARMKTNMSTLVHNVLPIHTWLRQDPTLRFLP